jgi:hypothetical protein
MQLGVKRMALREKYYGIMKKSLPAIVVVRFFQIESQVQLLADLQIASSSRSLRKRTPSNRQLGLPKTITNEAVTSGNAAAPVYGVSFSVRGALQTRTNREMGRVPCLNLSFSLSD